MRQVWAAALLAVIPIAAPEVARAGNSDEVNAGIDVTLTGGAVVATTYTGAALWYNPAGLARIDKSTFELTGVTFQMQVVRIPGILTLSTGEKSEGKTFNFAVIPQAITFTLKLRRDLKLGVGLFNSSIRRVLVTEQVMSAEGTSPEASGTAGQNSRLDFFHASAGVAGQLDTEQELILGGALDFVVATARIDNTLGVFYDGGTSGFVTRGRTETQIGFGLQVKAGFQWAPIDPVRIGMSVASPSYVFAILERSATTFGQAPPAGTIDMANPQEGGGEENRSFRGGWFGVEPGNLRLGIAYVAKWGWIEGDVIASWRLRTPDLGLDLKTVVNGRIGSAFRLSPKFQLGLGLFTDLSQTDMLAIAPLATADVNFYGFNVGFLFSNQEVHPDRPPATQAAPEDEGDKKTGLAIAIGVRYSFGRGDALGVLLPAQYDPSAITDTRGSGKIHEIAINLAAKVAF